MCIIESCYGVATISRLLKIIVSFAKESYKREYILQKKPIILRSLLIVATPYTYTWFIHVIPIVMLLEFVCVSYVCCSGATATHHCNTLQQHAAMLLLQHTTATHYSNTLLQQHTHVPHAVLSCVCCRSATGEQYCNKVLQQHIHGPQAVLACYTTTLQQNIAKLLRHHVVLQQNYCNTPKYCTENAHTIPRQYRCPSAMHCCNTLHCCNNTHKAVLPHYCNTLLQHTTLLQQQT